MATTHPFVMTVPWSQHVFIGDFAAAASVSELNKRKITRLLSVGEAPVFSYEHIMSLQLPFAGISPLKNGEPRKIKQLPPLQQAQLPHAEISYLNACCSFITGQPSQAPLLKRPRTLVYSETGLKHPVMIAVGYLLLCKNAPLADVAKVFGPLCIHADCCLVPVDLHQLFLLEQCLSQSGKNTIEFPELCEKFQGTPRTPTPQLPPVNVPPHRLIIPPRSISQLQTSSSSLTQIPTSHMLAQQRNFAGREVNSLPNLQPSIALAASTASTPLPISSPLMRRLSCNPIPITSSSTTPVSHTQQQRTLHSLENTSSIHQHQHLHPHQTQENTFSTSTSLDARPPLGNLTIQQF